MGLTLQRTILIPLCAIVSIGLFWCNMKLILLLCGQDESMINLASTYIVLSLPDLVTQAFLHPLSIYLRTQNITLPLALCAVIVVFVHVPLNFLLVRYLNMGIQGVALAAMLTNFNMVLSLLFYLYFSGVYKKS